MSDLLGRHGPKLAVGGLVALNLVLIGTLVLRDPVRTAVPATPVPASSSLTASATPSPTPSATPSSPSPARPSDDARQPTRLLAANSARVAWRATSTDCEGSAEVEVTTDGGRSWSTTTPGLTAIVRLKAYGDGSVFAIGADDRCRATYAWITGPGARWQRDRDRAGDIWFRSPDNLNEVHAPGGDTSKPCGDGLRDLAGLGTFQAAVLCADGRIRTAAEGRSWRTVQQRSKALSLNADDNTFVMAGTRDGCPGVVVRRFDSAGDGLRSRGGCRSDVESANGSTVVSVRLEDVWLWSADSVHTY